MRDWEFYFLIICPNDVTTLRDADLTTLILYLKAAWIIQLFNQVKIVDCKLLVFEISLFSKIFSFYRVVRKPGSTWVLLWRRNNLIVMQQTIMRMLGSLPMSQVLLLVWINTFFGQNTTGLFFVGLRFLPRSNILLEKTLILA